MPESHKVTQIRLEHPLSSETRKERRALVAVAAATATLVHTGLVPQKIENLGITFQATDQRALVIIFALATVYFIAAFGVHGFGDYMAYRARFHQAVHDAAASYEALGEPEKVRREAVEIALRVVKESSETLFRREPLVARLRFAFDIALPFILGVYAAVAASVAAFQIRG